MTYNQIKESVGVVISSLSKNCAIPSICSTHLEELKLDSNSEASFVRLIKCMSSDNTLDKDLLTLQSSILTELKQIPGGSAYFDKYCTFLYKQIYLPWVYATKDHIDTYIEKFESLCIVMEPALLSLKQKSPYKNLSNRAFLDGIKNLSIVFLVLEFADSLSSYGYGLQSSIVDKMNQILREVSIEGTQDTELIKLKNKRNLSDTRDLPKIYKQMIEYKLGCNCLCNSIFVLSFLRILYKKP